MTYDITYMWNLKYDTNEAEKNREIQNRLVIAKVEGVRERDRLGVWDQQMQWIDNKVLLYSTGSYTQYPVINHNRKEFEKKVYVYYN